MNETLRHVLQMLDRATAAEIMSPEQALEALQDFRDEVETRIEALKEDMGL
jgi:hypothetical protein